MKAWWIALFLLVGLAAPAFAQPPPSPLVLGESIPSPSLAGHLEVLKDPSRTLSFAEVSGPLSGRFTAAPSTLFGEFGSRSAWWLRLAVDNRSHHRSWVFAILGGAADGGNLELERVEVYRQGQRTLVRDLRHHPSNDSVANRNAVFFIPFDFDRPSVIYVHVVTTPGFLTAFRPAIKSEKSFFNYEQTRQILLGAFFGIFAAIIIYTIGLARSSRVSGVAYYVVYLIGFCLVWFLQDCMDYSLSIGVPSGWRKHLIPLFWSVQYVCQALFLIKFLRIDDCSKLIAVLLKGVALVASVIAFLNLVMFQKTYMAVIYVAAAVDLLITPLTLAAGIAALRRRVPSAGYILVGWGALTASILAQVLDQGGYLPHTMWLYNGPHFGAIAETVLFSLALSDRIRVLRLTQAAEAQRLLHLEHAVAVAEQASKAKSSFVTLLSHEIRTPLNGLLGTLRLLASSSLGERQREWVDAAAGAGRMLLGIVNQVLDFGRIEAGRLDLNPAPTDLRALAGRVAALFDAAARAKGLVIGCDVDPGLPAAVLVDGPRLEQVLANLVGNAVKFTEAGRVNIRISGAADGPTRIAVADSGPGIAADLMPRLFRPFEQGGGAGQAGTGLGLAICRHLVEAMGGTIAVDSRPGAGTTFTVTLALPATAPVPRSAADADLIRAHPRSLALLVVDDSPINRLVAAELLRHHGHRVTEAADGGEAVALAQSERFDAILMDVSMPGIDGVDATRMIRALPDDRRAAVPIIATTAHAFPEDTARLLGLGFSGVLIKPVDEALLLATLADTACAPPARPAMGRPGGLVDVTGLQARLGHMAAPQVEDFLNGLREAMAHDLDALDAAAAAGRPNDVGRAAHRIAGAAAHFGLSALRDAAIDLERRLRGGAVDTAEAGALRVLWARTSRELASAAARPAAVVAPPV